MSVENWRVDDAPTLSSTQTAVRNLSRLVWLILVSVFWRERLSCQSVPWGVELRSCIVSVVVEERVGEERGVCHCRFVTWLSRGSLHAPIANVE